MKRFVSRSPSAPSAGDGQVRPPWRTPPARVLVAEDHPVNRAVIAGQLRHLGYAVTLVEDGRQALDAMARSRYDLVLTDCRMPRMDGLALARAIRQGECATAPRLPIVALSGSASRASRDACLAAGMDGYLAKPTRVGELQRELSRHLAAAHRTGPPPLATDRERRDLHRLSVAFGSGDRARQVLRPLLDACRADLAALDAALHTGDRGLQRELAHRLQGALALAGAHSAPHAGASPRPPGPARQRDLLARRIDALQRLLLCMEARGAGRDPA